MENAFKILVGKPEVKNDSEDVGIDGRIILEWISGRLCEGVYWINLTQDREQWRALVYSVMNLWVP
jgi:hypothetical protein